MIKKFTEDMEELGEDILNSTGLTLFKKLCDVGNALELLRDLDQPASDQWVWHTDLLADLDEAIDLLVDSGGIDDDDA